MALKQMHDIDGRRMTVDEIAGMLGVTKCALYRRKHVMGCSYQVIVDMYRDNRLAAPDDKYPRYMVDGKWITVRDISLMLGVREKSINQWRQMNRDAAGNLPPMKDAVEHFRNYKRFGRKKRVGKAHRVKGHTMTVAEAAAKYGVTDGTIYMYMRKHRCSLETYIRNLEKRRVNRAVREIMGIICQTETAKDDE